MKVLGLMLGADTGGVYAATRHAFESYGGDGWEYRTLISSRNYIGYSVDIAWDEGVIAEWWRWADVIHTGNNLTGIQMLRKGWHGFRLPRRPIVVTFHGTGFRELPKLFLGEADKWQAIAAVSTLDLYLLAPDKVTWLPNPVNVDAMQAIERTTEDSVVRIAHAPTNRTIKSTDAFLEAIGQLQRDGYDVEPLLIEHQPWAECLRLKASADIYFDQVKLGYGNNAIEAWGMGIPVIAGGADPTLDEMERRFGSLPFLHATEDTIYDALREMVESPALRQHYAERGLEHVRQYHDERVVVEQLKDVYLRAAGTRGERAA